MRELCNESESPPFPNRTHRRNQVDDTTRLLAGKVVFHSAIRDEVDRKAIELRLPYFALRYFGPIPEHMVLML